MHANIKQNNKMLKKINKKKKLKQSLLFITILDILRHLSKMFPNKWSITSLLLQNNIQSYRSLDLYFRSEK